jgi:hypothetical protein
MAVMGMVGSRVAAMAGSAKSAVGVADREPALTAKAVTAVTAVMAPTVRAEVHRRAQARRRQEVWRLLHHRRRFPRRSFRLLPQLPRRGTCRVRGA